jgi:hypothetical protein
MTMLRVVSGSSVVKALVHGDILLCILIACNDTKYGITLPTPIVLPSIS